MYRRTFEVLSKWVADKNNVSIQFDTDVRAKVDMKNTIHMPKEIANENALAALALMMHEAAHVKHSKKIPIKEICASKADFSILNACEDIRIDNKNFGLLPNVKEFYRELVEKHINLNKREAPLSNKAICHEIMYQEGFQPKADKETRELALKIRPHIQSIVYYIELSKWETVKDEIHKIKNILGIKPKDDLPPDVQMGSGVQSDDPANDLTDVESLIRPGTVWSKGDNMKGGATEGVGALAMDDINAQLFKEILNVKENRIVSEGDSLDTDSLLSAPLGNVGELFKESRVVKRKKSKVAFLIDQSGSMSAPMIDGKKRIHVVIKSVKKITQLISEVSEIEGVSVDWSVSGFTTGYHKYTKENWEMELVPYGGTRFLLPFRELVRDLLEDYTIEGKRIVVVLTDGDIDDTEIKEVKNDIVALHQDIRVLVIGVGCMPNGAMVTEIVGDNVILAEADAETVIMETIKTML